MRVILASVSVRALKSKLAATDSLVDEYLGRLEKGRWLQASTKVFPSQSALLQAATKARPRPVLVLLDSRGKAMSSEHFAAWLGQRRDSGTQELWLAIGPADGWSPTTTADLTLSLGPITLPHELARVVMAEQIYRAWAILEGHPYHAAHRTSRPEF